MGSNLVDISQIYMDVHTRLQNALFRTLTLIERPDNARLHRYEDVINFVCGVPETDLFPIIKEGRDLCVEFNRIMDEGPEEAGTGEKGDPMTGNQDETKPLPRPHRREQDERPCQTLSPTRRELRNRSLPASPLPS